MDLFVLLRAAVETAKISFPTVLEARRGTLKHEDCDRRLRRWAARLLAQVRAEVTVEGLDHLKDQPGPFIVVSNHESQYDIPVLYVALPLSLRMAAKAELFKTPLWGEALRASGFVEINRSTPKAAYKALRSAGTMMREHALSLYIAPEGTRTSDGHLGTFKKGAFDVAKVTGVPILPVAILGTRAIHGKGSWRVTRDRQVTVKILPPIAPEDFQAPDVMAEMVKAQIAQARITQA